MTSLIVELSCSIGRTIASSCLTGVVVVSGLVDPLDDAVPSVMRVRSVVPINVVGIEPQADAR